ncbi:transcription factor bHLH110-like isoform X4 [Durio zibethinus]|uniref:Transcription factor bHLH110-like isoform X4 n=1 Tax=Durio zibethinus TaxID=66656 RepID=A0A6P6AVX8_DURZI|nr:transcription factor bHLH110-like isoform X4 [Durio zibethinus]
MEPENVHHQHQLQDQLVGSSSLPIPPSYGVASSTHSWTPTSSSIILNTSEFIPVYNGDISHSMQKNSILAYSSQNSSMIQDWTNNEGSFATHSCHDIHLAKIKEELSESLTRFTEMLSDTSSRDVGDSRQLPPTNYLKNNEQKDLHDLSEKLLLKTISSGFPMFSAGSEFYSTTQNCSIPGSTCLPSRRNFSQIYPSINISNLSQASSPNIPSSFDMNLEALDLLSPARFSSRSSFTNPSRDHNNLGIYKEISPSFGFHHHHFQQSNQRPAYSPSKVRKEKLGDRIAALQQLVAPFGKTDTASVLMEAIGYIKFLQNQVETLSVPYMKSYRNKTSRSKQGGSTMEEGNEEEAKRDLRSRGLCLVPLSCMSYVTNDSGGSIWPPPNFTGGTYNNNC